MIKDENIGLDSEYKYAELSGYICHALMMCQIIEKSKMFEFSKRIFSWIDEDIFNKVLTSLNKSAAITVITDKYIYQTTSTLSPQKTLEEIKLISGQ